MAAVYLTDLIPTLEAALSVPGTTSPYSAATDDEWLHCRGRWSPAPNDQHLRIADRRKYASKQWTEVDLFRT